MTTRGLDYRFLWVNALCIIQPKASGDSTDWEIEGPRMGLIYQNVVCTIAATCAENADEGFLSTVGSGSLNIMPCTITDRRQGARHIQLSPAQPPLRWSIDNATLNNRRSVNIHTLLQSDRCL
jgi:hypothetical protein